MCHAEQLRVQISKHGQTNEEKADDIDEPDKDAIIEHLEHRLRITENENEAFIEKRESF